MAETFGPISLPQDPPDVSTTATLDPALDTLAEAIPAILNRTLGEAWQAIEQATPVVGTVLRFDPKAVFDGSNVTYQSSVGQPPALFLFSARGDSTQLCDEHSEFRRELSVFWVPDSRINVDLSNDDTLFASFARAIIDMVQEGRDPAWVSSTDDTTSSEPAVEAKRVIARRFGSDIQAACGFSHWAMAGKGAIMRDHFTLTSIKTEPMRYDGFLAKITCSELSTRDPAARGYVSTSLQQTLTTSDSLLTTGGFRRAAAP